MKFNISKTDFLNALNITAKGRSGRSTLPILSGVYIKAQDGSILLQTTDLETSVRVSTPALVENEGETVVPGKLISELVKTLPEAAVSCSLDGEQFIIECLSSRFSMKTMQAKDFPAFPEVEAAESIVIPAGRASEMVKKVSKAVSRDESHMILTGINVVAEGENISMVATDSYRLAIDESSIENHDGTFQLVIPGSVLDDVCRLLGKEDSLEIGYNDNQILFKFGQSTFVTRKLEGNYPNYKQIIPKEKTISAVVETKTLLDAIKRVSVMAQEYMQIRLELLPELQQIVISAKVADVGGAKETVDAQIDGEQILIGFNYQYLMDGLNAISTEEVVFEANSPLKPGVLKSVGEEKFFYLSMPVKLND
ncbi:MAG: DNA polymerase III subunit beta [Coriobacteriales bacterium]